MANTILNRKQIPSALAYVDEVNTFTQSIFIPLASPTTDAQVANKKYVDEKVIAASTGLTVKDSVRATTTSSVGTYNATAGSQGRGRFTAAPNVVDGVTLVNGDRLLVKNNSAAAGNGIYIVTTAGTGATGVWDRASDFDTDSEVRSNAFCFVEEGTTLADTAFVLTTNNPITIGGSAGTSLSFTQFAGSGVGISSVAVNTANGLNGTSSGGSNPTLTLGTSLGIGIVKSNGSGAFVIGTVDLSSSDVINTLPVSRGGTGVNNLSGIVKGNGTGAFSAATGVDLTTLIAANFVENATNSTNNAITNDTTTAATMYLSWVTATSGNLPMKVSSTKLTFNPSTGLLTSTAFSGNGSGLSSLNASNLTSGTVPNARISGSYTGIVNLTGSGSVDFAKFLGLPSDTVTAPSYTWTGDNTTGFYRPASSQIGVAIAGIQRVLISASGMLVAGSVQADSFIGNVTGSSASFTGNLAGDVTGGQSDTSIASTIVTGKVLTNFSASSGTVAATDTILVAFNKLAGNANSKQNTISSSNYKVGVAVTGAANGTNVTFTLPNDPIDSTEMLFVNGVVQQRGAGNDYQISGATVTFEAGNAPQLGAILVATFFI